MGRVFFIRLEHGEIVTECIERVASDNGVSHGYALMVGGVGGGQVVVGPRKSDERPVEPMLLPIGGAHEVAAVGILAQDKSGKPIMHLHGALGRSGQTVTGCLRVGAETWLVGEVVLFEVLGVKAVRKMDKKSGFELLEVD